MPAFSYIGGAHGRGLLQSALAQPRQTFNGKYLYRTVYDKGAALVLSLIENHPFIDGNKRMGMATLNMFLIFNYYIILSTKQETVDFALGIANREIGQHQGALWLHKYSMSIESLMKLKDTNTPFPQHLSEQLTQQANAVDVMMRTVQSLKSLYEASS